MEEVIIMQLTGLILIVVSIPLIYGKIKPNRWYWFRTPATLSDEQIWYKANKQTSIDMCIVWLFMIFTSMFFEKYEQLFIYFPFIILWWIAIMMLRWFLLIDKMKRNKKD